MTLLDAVLVGLYGGFSWIVGYLVGRTDEMASRRRKRRRSP